jgi:hypothetical protein
MLESYIFHKTNVLIKIIKLILLIKKYMNFKGLERSIRDVGVKKRVNFQNSIGCVVTQKDHCFFFFNVLNF